MEVVAYDDQNLVKDTFQIRRGKHRLAGIIKDCDLLHGWPDSTAPQMVTEGSEGNQVILVAYVQGLVVVRVLYAPSYGFDDPENNQAKAEIHSHPQVKTSGHVAVGDWQVRHHKEINEVTHNDCRQGVGEVLHYLFRHRSEGEGGPKWTS